MDFNLIIKKINNSLTTEEREIFDSWYKESDEHRFYFNRVKDNYRNDFQTVDIQKGWVEVSTRINKKRKRKYLFRYASIVTTFLTIGSLWFFNTQEIKKQSKTKQSLVVQAQPIEIGSNKAILTLDDGTQITLNKGKSFKTNKVSSNGEQLVYNNNKNTLENSIAKNILTIPKGGEFYVVLSDGTKVWLNSDTQLKYPVAFIKNKTRVVELVSGEAYFEVSPSAKHNGSRFIVQSKGQEVEVLGTQFNIKAYTGDNFIATTLVEGKVKIKNEQESKNLLPGQQSKLDFNSNKFGITKVDVYNEISWKSGLFSFNNKSLSEIMEVLSRWYNVDVIFEKESLKSLKFNGVFRKDLKINVILNIIKNTNEVQYEINKNTIIMK